jgi:hypothetical protein
VDIETEPDCEIGSLAHPIREGGEDFATLMNRKADDQDSMLGLRKHFAQHDTGITRAAALIGAACDQLDLRPPGFRSPFGRNDIEHQGGMLRIEASRE